MAKHVIIAISRQYGSNGRELGRQLAEYLDIGYYDKEIVEQIAASMALSPEFFSDDNRSSNGMFSMGFRLKSSFQEISELSLNSQIFEGLSRIIHKIADTESAVIIGRCADYILRDDHNCISVYCYSDLDERLERAVNEYKVPRRKARRYIFSNDEKRKRFYEYHTQRKWGDFNSYDIVINTSKMTMEEAIYLLADAYDERLGFSSIKGGYTDQYLHLKKQYGN